MGRVVHFEIPADDLTRVKRFYSTVFEWQVQQMDPEFGNYIMVLTTGIDDKTRRLKTYGSINGGMADMIGAERSARLFCICT